MSEQPTSPQDTEEKASQFRQIIIDTARNGGFNHNPLLSTAHFVTCQRCKKRQRVVYLDYLKSGAFDFGKAEQIEVLTPQGAIGFVEIETVTPIVISFSCDECGCLIEVKPISAEYLKVIINKPKSSGTMFV
jgi:hypothetical protein